MCVCDAGVVVKCFVCLVVLLIETHEARALFGPLFFFSCCCCGWIFLIAFCGVGSWWRFVGFFFGF